MNFIRWWTAGFMLMGMAMTLNLCVVCLFYWIYLDAEPEMRQELPTVIYSTLLFLVLALVGVAAFIPLIRKNRWLWPTQGLLLASVFIIGFIFYKAFR